MNALTEFPEHNSDNEDDRYDKEKDQFSGDPFFFFFAEMTLPPIRTHTFAITTRSSVLALSTARIRLDSGEGSSLTQALHDNEICALVDKLVLSDLLDKLHDAVSAGESTWETELLAVEARASSAREPAIEVG